MSATKQYFTQLQKRYTMNLPKIKDIYEGVAEIQKNDEFIVLMNQQPANTWVKEHPFIKNYKYIPIERVEFLLKTIFKRYRIEITNQGTAFNGVWVTVRVHYQHPVTGEWDYHDGIGACQLQTKAGTSPTDLINLNNGALSMAFPIAKTVAIKDACDHFGKLFGSDLNRKDIITYEIDDTLIKMDENHPKWAKVCEAIKAHVYTVEQIDQEFTLSKETEQKLIDLWNSSK